MQVVSEVYKVVQQICAVSAHKIDWTSIAGAEEFAEVGKDDLLVHIRILYGQVFCARVGR